MAIRLPLRAIRAAARALASQSRHAQAELPEAVRERLQALKDDLALASDLLRDYATRRYRRIPYWAVTALAALALYLASPIDLIPDFIPGIGQIDDVAVLLIALRLLRKELDAYEAWRTTPDAEVVDITAHVSEVPRLP